MSLGIPELLVSATSRYSLASVAHHFLLLCQSAASESSKVWVIDMCGVPTVSPFPSLVL
jgi:hypothetical protein